MNRFNFRLESILRLYRAQESEAKIGLGLAVQARNIAETRLDQTRSWLPELASRPDLAAPRPFSLTPGVHAAIELSKLAVDAAEVVVEQRRGELVEAKRNTELFERLKAKQLDRHNQEMLRRESIDLLEISMLMMDEAQR